MILAERVREKRQLEKKKRMRNIFTFFTLLLFTAFTIYALYNSSSLVEPKPGASNKSQRKMLQEKGLKNAKSFLFLVFDLNIILFFCLSGSSSNEEQKESLSLFLLVALLVFCFLIAYLIRQFSFTYLHESMTTILFGLALGVTIRYLSNSEMLKSVATFNQKTFFIFFLPPIIFESGYNMNQVSFLQKCKIN